MDDLLLFHREADTPTLSSLSPFHAYHKCIHIHRLYRTKHEKRPMYNGKRPICCEKRGCIYAYHK